MTDIFYRMNGKEFELVSRDEFGVDTMWRGPEVAIGFTYDGDADRGIQYTTHRHGSPETVEAWAEKTRAAIEVANSRGIPMEEWAQPRWVSSDQWDVEELNRIINTTGYLGIALEKLGLNIV